MVSSPQSESTMASACGRLHAIAPYIKALTIAPHYPMCCIAGKYTVFGHVIDGLDVLDKMEKVPTGMFFNINLLFPATTNFPSIST